MNNQNPNAAKPRAGSSHGSRWPWLLALACLLMVLMALFLRRPKESRLTPSEASVNSSAFASRGNSSSGRFARGPHFRPPDEPAPTAQEIVAAKVNEFGRQRREIVRAIARRAGTNVPPEVERFFDAIESGRWEEIEAQWQGMRNRSGQYEGSTHAPELDPYWAAVLDAYGVAEQAHLWPAQKLLDYGNAVLDSLRPGMVYVGGTDPGRWIPELLNDTSDGERHIIVTQNAFADGRYLDYMSELYNDRFATLSKEDSQRAFQEYMADAQKRLQHDREFPNEPKQVRPGEDIRMVDAEGQASDQMELLSTDNKNQRIQVSGQVAVMAINERLLKMLMEKNPDVSFAMEESFPFTSMFADATPLGPLMELRVRDEQNALTPERAAQSVDYWRTAAQQLLNDSEVPDGDNPRKAWSKMVSAQAGLLLDRNYPAEAEQAFRIAIELCPYSPEAVFRYVNLLAGQNRFADAIPVVENAVKAAPDNTQLGDLLMQLKKVKPN